jgi:hypothetical protein
MMNEDLVGLRNKLLSVQDKLHIARNALLELTKCEFDDNNCASLEIASSRIRKFAWDTIKEMQ